MDLRRHLPAKSAAQLDGVYPAAAFSTHVATVHRFDNHHDAPSRSMGKTQHRTRSQRIQPPLFPCRRFHNRGVGARLHHVQSTNTKRRTTASQSVLASKNVTRVVSLPVSVTTFDRGVLFDDLLGLVQPEWRAS